MVPLWPKDRPHKGRGSPVGAEDSQIVDGTLKVNHFVDAHRIGGARVVSDGVVSLDA